MFAAQGFRTIEQMAIMQISPLVEDSLPDILQFTYEKARTRVRSVVYSVVVKVLFDLMRQEMMDNILHKHMANNINTSNTTDMLR